ncbi:MAG: FkbM family methyltransferase [Hyphomonadaceae bacterium]
MFVLCLGISRSASTWLFNAAYQVLSHDGAIVKRGFADTLAQAAPFFEGDADHILIKSHRPDAALVGAARHGGVLLLTMRDPRDAAVSSVQMFGGSVAHQAKLIGRSSSAVMHCQTFKNARLWRYEDRFQDAAPSSVREIADALGVRLPDPTADAIAAGMSRVNIEREIASVEAAPDELLLRGDGDVVHKLTHWHANHLRDGRVGKWRDLAPAERELLNAALQPFVLAWGYDNPAPQPEWPVACFLSQADEAPLSGVSCDKAGYLLYGPYCALPAGAWRLVAKLSFERDAGAEERPDIVFDVARNGVSLGELHPPIAEEMTVSTDFEHDDPLATLEFRMRLLRPQPGWRAFLRNVSLSKATRAKPPEQLRPSRPKAPVYRPMNFLGEKDQDRWVVEEALCGKREGWFLDLAATDGVTGNNTLVLERELAWNGLCIEPNPIYFEALRRNRRCAVSAACVDEAPGVVEFWPNGGLGGIIADDTDNSRATRASQLDEAYARGEVMRFETRTLEQVLEEHRAPPVIDYFSFDVEGAETRILRRFPFNRWRFLCLTVERPTPELNRLLFANGYVFVRNLSYDSFYVHKGLPGIDRLKIEPFEQVPAKDW